MVWRIRLADVWGDGVMRWTLFDKISQMERQRKVYESARQAVLYGGTTYRKEEEEEEVVVEGEEKKKK